MLGGQISNKIWEETLLITTPISMKTLSPSSTSTKHSFNSSSRLSSSSK